MDASIIISKLQSLLGSPGCELDFDTPWQLLVAVVLSAQCTDKRVNTVTARLFQRAPDPASLLRLDQSELEQLLRPVGLYRAKAANIRAICQQIIDQHGGQVPCERAALQALPGVGRKTANVLLHTLCNQPVIAVDTHISRVSQRLGISQSTNVSTIEADLYQALPEALWGVAHHLLLHFGRYYCTARAPKCQGCVLADECKFVSKN